MLEDNESETSEIEDQDKEEDKEGMLEYALSILTGTSKTIRVEEQRRLRKIMIYFYKKLNEQEGKINSLDQVIETHIKNLTENLRNANVNHAENTDVINENPKLTYIVKNVKTNPQDHY